VKKKSVEHVHTNPQLVCRIIAPNVRVIVCSSLLFTFDYWISGLKISGSSLPLPCIPTFAQPLLIRGSWWFI